MIARPVPATGRCPGQEKSATFVRRAIRIGCSPFRPISGTPCPVSSARPALSHRPLPPACRSGNRRVERRRTTRRTRRASGSCPALRAAVSSRGGSAARGSSAPSRSRCRAAPGRRSFRDSVLRDRVCVILPRHSCRAVRSVRRGIVRAMRRNARRSPGRERRPKFCSRHPPNSRPRAAVRRQPAGGPSFRATGTRSVAGTSGLPARRPALRTTARSPRRSGPYRPGRG